VKVYRQGVAQGSIEPLRTGFRARVFAGRDPITGRKKYLRGETRRVRRDAEADRDRLLAQVEADQHPDQHATIGVLLDRWTEVVDHELSTASTTAGYVRRTLNPALGDVPGPCGIQRPSQRAHGRSSEHRRLRLLLGELKTLPVRVTPP
jgi:hypothetical protein